MADKKVTPVTKTTDKDILVGLNNLVAMVKNSDDGPSEGRLVRLAQYTRAFYGPMRESLGMEEGLLRPKDGLMVLLACALLTHQASMVAEDRKIPAQVVLDILFDKEEE